jgi:hypothetical protein
MPKDKPWTVDEEATLRELVEANTPIDAICVELGKKTDAVYVKCLRLGLTQKHYTKPSNVPLPKELPSVEEALKKLAMALDIASTPGLEKAEVQRLQVLATIAKTYKEILADYINYREIEAKLYNMEAKYDALFKETGKDDASRPSPAQIGEAPTSRQANPTSQT